METKGKVLKITHFEKKQMSDLRKHCLGERTTQWLPFAWFRGKFMPLKYFENKMTQFQRLASFDLQQILTCENLKLLIG